MADNYMTFNDAVEVLTPYAEKINTIKPESITWAAYQLLTSEQKAAKRYLITDYPSPTGYVNKLSDLEDVSINSQTLSNGQVPVYNSTNEVWENKTILENSLTSTATDVALTAAQGKVLQDTKQAKTLATPITVDGTQETTVEGALGGLNDYGDALADNLAANENVYGVKQMLPYPFNETTKTENAITFTDNGNGTITVNGIASNDTNFFCRNRITDPMYLKNGTYKFTGCPSGGGSSSYEVDLIYQDSGGSIIYLIDVGNGVEVTVSGSYGDANGANFGVVITIYNGANISTPITFRPMIRDSRIVDDTFVPYAETNLQLTKKTSGLSNENLLDNGWFTVNQRGFSSAIFQTGNVYTVDRWLIIGTTIGGSMSLSSSGMKLSRTGESTPGYLTQFLEDLTLGKPYTLSVLFADGTIESRTGIINSTADSISFSLANGLGSARVYYFSGGSKWTVDVIVFAGSEFTIRAVKLELGSVSTLANDVAPDYAFELAKCRASTADPSDTYANKGNLVNYADLTTIHATGSTNTTGAQIDAGTFFYLNGSYCKALTNIAVNATFTLNTNYKVDSVGEELKKWTLVATATGDGVKTWSQVISEISSPYPATEPYKYLIVLNDVQCFHPMGRYSFALIDGADTSYGSAYIRAINMATGGFYEALGTLTFTNYATGVFPSGNTLKLYKTS